MKQKYFLLILLFTLFQSCQLESGFSAFNDAAADFAIDKHIDKKEYEMLLSIISTSDNEHFKIFKSNGKIDDGKVISYLLKYYNAKKIAITSDDIWKPVLAEKTKKFNVNVFLENSASMDGYVKGVTEFETAIYNLLGDFRISHVCDSLNLNYINKGIPYAKKNALSPDIKDFIEKLEPSTFRERGGDRSTSDLKNILNTVLKSVDKNNASVLISDFVFSPGNKANAQDYLNNQSVGIKIDFAEKLDNFDLSVVIIQLESNFDGMYYDKTDNPISLKCKRPYYIWIIGSNAQIKAILDKKILDNIRGGYHNRIVMQSLHGQKELPNFKILYRPRIGEFNSKSLDKGIILDAEQSNMNGESRVFGFKVAVDFSKSLQDRQFFTDVSNYELSNKKYSLKVEAISDPNNVSLREFTHVLSLQTNDLTEETIKINVVGKIPGWVHNSTSDDDSAIASDQKEKAKTFGFKHLIDGVCDAFYPRSDPNEISTVNITIKK